MALTQCTVGHSFLNPDGTAASGKVTFVLSKRLSNGTQTVMPGEVVATLNGSGAISVSLYANNDAGTVPGDSSWEATLRILGASEESYSIIVPTNTASADLASLLPQATTGG